MAEALISPGVFLRENDLSQITAGPIAVGAALVGPTVIGKPNIPTLVTSYSEFRAKFGTTFISGGTTREYLTSQAAYNYFQQGGVSLLVTRVASGSYTAATSSLIPNSVSGAIAGAFDLETLSVGDVMNNDFSASAAVNQHGLLPLGTVNNVRWQISQADTATGYFTLLIRRGDDYTNSQTVLETWTNLSLDPNQNNYIEYVIGDQSQTILTDNTGQAYLQISGSYPNRSNYVRVKSVNYPTPNYLDSRGQAVTAYTASIPLNGSGSLNGAFGGATGPLYGCYGVAPLNLFEDIPSSPSDQLNNGAGSNIQGIFAADYNTAINLLANKDSYVYKSIYLPGLSSQNGPDQIAGVLSVVSGRGDAIAVVDMVGYNQQINIATQEAQSYDNSYGATYWPWVQVRSTETGKLHFVPASTIVPAVYEYNDKVSAEWFAPAGLNRGGLPTVIQPERRLTVSQRNTLYTAKVNPIAVFPGQGTVIYGQKTLQARASALDRVNVRRLLIALKSYIGQIAQTLVFEQNTAVTRNRFLSQVNPYLQYVQQRQGLYSFRVVMDETNNTPDVIDRNLLVGAIYLQPTRTAEFIQLDFNILPTGVTFGQ
jgi:Phage tail sheath protein subtilisin-like domain/Phage tail sheath C-terminal domain